MEQGPQGMKHEPIEQFEKNVQDASIILKSMKNSHRLIVLCRLPEGECSVGELEPLVEVSQSTLSQHLARLRRDQLVTTRRDAQIIFYSLANENSAILIEVLCNMFPTGKAAMR